MFGMGTGGSLRLLSPETIYFFGLSHPQNRTGSGWFGLTKTALLPSKLHKSFWLSCLGVRYQVQVSGLCFRFRFGFSFSLFPVPFSLIQDQALDRLVSSSSTRYRASTDDLSTLSSSRGLTCLIQWQFYSPGGLHA